MTRHSWIFQHGVTVLNGSPPQLPAAAPQMSLFERIKKLPPTARWAVDFPECNDEGDDIASAICHGTARCVSNGSYKLLRGTAAFVIHGSSLQCAFRVVNALR